MVPYSRTRRRQWHLKANDILLVKNAFAVKVVATQTTGSQTVLIIDRARLVDVVAEARFISSRRSRSTGPG